MRTALVQFSGGDYELIHAIPPLSRYVSSSIVNGISVDFLCPNIKVIDRVLCEFVGFNAIYKNADSIDVNGYYYTKTVAIHLNGPPDSFLRRVCNTLGISYIGCETFRDITFNSRLLSQIKKSRNSAVFNMLSFNTVDFNKHDTDIIRCIVVFESQVYPCIIFGTNSIHSVTPFVLTDIHSIITFASMARSYFGSDGIVAQICAMLEIPCYIKRMDSKKLIKTSLDNVLYKDDFCGHNQQLEFIDKYWDVQNHIFRSKHQ